MGFAGAEQLFGPQLVRENKMFGSGKGLRSSRLVTMFFAFVSGLSAVSTAVVPGLHF